MNINKQLEYEKLDKEMAERRKRIVEKWHSGLPSSMRGECNTPEMKALIKEWYERFMEIKEKYKDEE